MFHLLRSVYVLSIFVICRCSGSVNILVSGYVPCMVHQHSNCSGCSVYVLSTFCLCSLFRLCSVYVVSTFHPCSGFVLCVCWLSSIHVPHSVPAIYQQVSQLSPLTHRSSLIHWVLNSQGVVNFHFEKPFEIKSPEKTYLWRSDENGAPTEAPLNFLYLRLESSH